MILGAIRVSRGRRSTILAAVLSASLACAVGAGAAPAAARAQASLPTQVISVDGAWLLDNGAPWVPRAVQIVGVVAPDGALWGKYIAAHAHFGSDELAAAKAEHADAIRLQVSQFGLDPQDTLYSRAYVQEVRSAIETARALGLAAIVSLQTEQPAGRGGRCPLPDAGTERVWNELAPMFASDPGVMFELYNEPGIAATPGGWQQWQNGGPVMGLNGPVCEAVGMQALIETIRDDQADNVIIVPGLKGEQTLSGMPALLDPASPTDPQLVYGIHYPSLTGGSALWDRQFGRQSATVPVIVTEWDQNSISGCSAQTPARAALLLDYLYSKGIGMVGFAFDLPGTIVADYSYAPTSYFQFECGVPGAGPGQLLFGDYAALAQADAPSQGDVAPAWLLTSSVFERLAVAAPGLAEHFFDTPRTFVSGASTVSLAGLGAATAVPTASFTDERSLAAAVDFGRLRSGTRAVMYEDESGSATPRAQQLNPGLYYRRAAQVAHAHGMLLIATPAPDLVSVISPRTPAPSTNSKFLKLRISAAAARYADIYEVQAQDAETTPAKYASFIRAAASQASAAHPGIELLAGLTTDIQPRRQASKLLLRAVSSAQPLVAGFWLNDPVQDTACRLCTGPHPGELLALLRALRASGA